MPSTDNSGSWRELNAWFSTRPGIRAVICDVYGTLLEVNPGPANADELWKSAWAASCPSRSFLSLESLKIRSDQRIAESHRQSRKRGIAHPEVNWEEITGLPIPLILEHARLQRKCHLSDLAADFLKLVSKREILLGICSNAQAYTKAELTDALKIRGLEFSLFDQALCFWSHEHGFAKPEPAAFTYLNEQAGQMNIQPREILMIGDREDNDILPAKAAGWLTWHLIPN